MLNTELQTGLAPRLLTGYILVFFSFYQRLIAFLVLYNLPYNKHY